MADHAVAASALSSSPFTPASGAGNGDGGQGQPVAPKAPAIFGGDGTLAPGASLPSAQGTDQGAGQGDNDEGAAGSAALPLSSGSEALTGASAFANQPQPSAQQVFLDDTTLATLAFGSAKQSQDMFLQMLVGHPNFEALAAQLLEQ